MSDAARIAAELKAAGEGYIRAAGALLAETVELRHHPEISKHDGQIEGAVIARTWVADLDRIRGAVPDAKESVARIAAEGDTVTIETLTTATLPDGPLRMTLKRVLSLENGQVVAIDQYEDGQSHRLRTVMQAHATQPFSLKS